MKLSDIQSSSSQFLCSPSRTPSTPQNNQNAAKGQFAEGVWTLTERTRYVCFIHYNRNAISSKLQRRASKIFKQMSQFIGTRCPSQCRSQNQKVYKRFRTLTRIVSEFKKEVGELQFKQAFDQLSEDPKIRFITEVELKLINVKEEAQRETSNSVPVSVGIQTEASGFWPMSAGQMWMFEMFKRSLMANAYCPMQNYSLPLCYF